MRLRINCEKDMGRLLVVVPSASGRCGYGRTWYEVNTFEEGSVEESAKLLAYSSELGIFTRATSAMGALCEEDR